MAVSGTVVSRSFTVSCSKSTLALVAAESTVMWTRFPAAAHYLSSPESHVINIHHRNSSVDIVMHEERRQTQTHAATLSE